LLDKLTSSQLSEWEAYDKLDPIGTWRIDFNMAYLACVITNIAQSVHGKKGASKQTTPMDFMPQWDSEGKQEQTVEEQKQILLDIFSHFKKKK